MLENLCDLLKFELGIALNENKARPISSLCVHQYSLNEMRRGRRLHAIAKCSPKHLLKTNARVNYFLSLQEAEASRGDL